MGYLLIIQWFLLIVVPVVCGVKIEKQKDQIQKLEKYTKELSLQVKNSVVALEKEKAKRLHLLYLKDSELEDYNRKIEALNRKYNLLSTGKTWGIPNEE